MTELPTFQSTSADFVQEIELNGQLVTIRITWNARSSYFYLILTDEDNVELGSTKLVGDYPIFINHQGLTTFEGDFLMLPKDITATDQITYDNFGDSWGLFYLTPSEVDLWKDQNGI